MENIYIATKTILGYKLTKLDINLSKYNIINNNVDTIYLEKKDNKPIIVDGKDIAIYNLKNSKIIEAIINNGSRSISRYNKLLDTIYIMIGNYDNIIKKTVIPIHKGKTKAGGYTYLDNINMSYKKQDNNIMIREIISQCKNNNISLQLKIEIQETVIIMKV